MSVIHEWDIETVTTSATAEREAGEVIEHDHRDSYADCLQTITRTPDAGCHYEIVLVRDDDKGRSWAYVEHGKLPEYFLDAFGEETSKIPQRFHNEIAKAKP